VLNAWRLANTPQDIRDKLPGAIRKQGSDDLDDMALLMGHQKAELVDWAISKEIVSAEDRDILLQALTALYDVIRVDAFDAAGIKAMAEAANGKQQVVKRD
jgi:acyl-CoA dehydrogenase